MAINKRRESVVLMEKREGSCEVRVVVCEYNGSVVDVYWDELRSVSVVVERGEKKRGESREEEDVRWNGVCVCESVCEKMCVCESECVSL
jgi:hypothetical protein